MDLRPLQLLVLSVLILPIKLVLHRSLDLHFSPRYFHFDRKSVGVWIRISPLSLASSSATVLDFAGKAHSVSSLFQGRKYTEPTTGLSTIRTIRNKKTLFVNIVTY